MKKKIFIGVIFLLCTIVGFSQSKRSMKLLQEGIKSNDSVKINEALTKGAIFYIDDLTFAINENNSYLAKLIVGHGISSTTGLLIAAKKNSLEMLTLMLSLGAKLVSEQKDVDGSAFMVSGKTLKQVPVAIKTDSLGKTQFIADSVVVDFLLNNSAKGYGFYWRYKTKNYTTGSLAMYYAILNKNPQMVKALISNGYDISTPIFIKNFDDFTVSGIGFMSAGLLSQTLKNGGTINLNNGSIWAKIDSEGYIITSMMPTPAIKTTALEFANKINDSEIISILSNGK